jgi:hypothetical protein
MGILRFINIPVMAVSFALGVFAVYFLSQNQQRVIYVYPTPDNLDAIQYKDNTDTCFTVKQTPMRGPADASKISKIPAQ